MSGSPSGTVTVCRWPPVVVGTGSGMLKHWPVSLGFPFLMAALLGLAAAAMAAQEYTVTDLGVRPGTPMALNNQGQILFTDLERSAALSGPASVLWSGGTITTIGLLPGGSYSTAYGLNDAGQVVGAGDTFVTWELMDPVTFHTGHAFVWQGGTPTDLDPSTITTSDGEFRLFIFGSVARGINNGGQVTGVMQTLVPGAQSGSMPILHAFVTSASGQINRNGDDLGLQLNPKLDSFGMRINNRGQVVGTAAGAQVWFLSTGGGFENIPIPKPPEGEVYGLNDAGVVVGEASGRAFILGAPGGLQYLPVAGNASKATGINNRGQVVGTGDGPFLYANSQVIDLNSRLAAAAGWKLQSADLINDKGQILGMGTRNGKSALVRLDPVDVTPSIVLQSASSCPGEKANGTVILDKAAPAGGVLVQLSGDPAIPGLPPTVTVTGGETEQSFSFYAPLTAGTYGVKAAVENDAGVAVSKGDTLIVHAPELTDFKLADHEVCSDDEAMGSVTLSCPAPADGLVVTLQSKTSNPLQVLIPATVAVAPGSTSATFPITPGFYNSKFSQEMVTIIASSGDGEHSAELTIQPTIDSVLLTPHTLHPGEAATALIRLNCAAPPGGRAVVVTSSNPSVATVNAAHPDQPLLVIFPPKSDTFQVTVTTRPAASAQTVTISASTLASTDSDDLQVQPPGG
jgi:uncharacterized membrane protein